MKSTRRLLSLAALSAGLIIAGGARAEDWKVAGNFGWLGVGKVFQIEKGHIYWVGEFAGNFANDKGKGSPLDQTGWKCPGFNDLDSNNKKSKAAGYCIVSDPSGDQAYTTWQCQGDTQNCNGTFEYTGGTGKYQGISGSNTFVGRTQVNWPDGTASGYSTFNR
jgi:hypothetical protein